MNGSRARIEWRRLLLAVAAGVALAPVAGAATADPEDDPSALFSLQRARREQERNAATAAPYRSDVPWPVGAEDEAGTRWLIVTAGPEWDEKPMSLSNGISPPAEIEQDSHGAGVWFVDAGAELFRSGSFSGGLAGSYWGAAYSDADLDTHYPTVAAWIDWRSGGDMAVRVRYDFGYSWIDYDSFATTHHIGPEIFKDWGKSGSTEFFAEYRVYDFHVGLPDVPTALPGAPPGTCGYPAPCGPLEHWEGSRKDRSGWGFIVGGEHRVQLDWNDTEIRGGYFYQHYIPDGAEFHNQSHELWIGATTALPLGFLLDGNLTFLYQGARNVSSYPDRGTLVPDQVWSLPGFRRHDRIWRLYMALARPITPNLSASLEWSFTDHDSTNVNYDFDRHRVGGYLTMHFD